MGFFTSDKEWGRQARIQTRHARMKTRRQRDQLRRWRRERRKRWLGL